MKRDLKRWLHGEVVKQQAGLVDAEYTEDEICMELLDSVEYGKGAEIIQFIWCEAQKQFLKDILDDIDESLDKLFRGKDQVKNDKAQLVAYEASVKQWLYNKYHYLKRKNGS